MNHFTDTVWISLQKNIWNKQLNKKMGQIVEYALMKCLRLILSMLIPIITLPLNYAIIAYTIKISKVEILFTLISKQYSFSKYKIT